MALNKTPEDIIREAEALIEEVQQGLSQTQNMDMDQMASSLSGKERADALAQAEEQFRKDMEDVEQEMAAEAARLSFANAAPRTGAPRRMRNIV